MDARAREAQRWLMGIQYASKRIEAKKNQIMQLRCMATNISVSYSADKVSGGGTHSRIEAAVVKIADIESQIADEITALSENRKKAVDMLESLSDEREKLVLELRYMGTEPEPWAKIMRLLFMERSQSFAVHHSALIHIYEKMEGYKNEQPENNKLAYQGDGRQGRET